MITRISAARALLTVAVAVTLLTAGCGAVSITRATPPLQIFVEDAVGALSSTAPPVLRTTVTQEGQPVEGLEVRFAGLNADGENLGGLGFATTDSNGVATAPAQQPSGTTLERTLFEATMYEATANTQGGASSGRGVARLDITP